MQYFLRLRSSSGRPRLTSDCAAARAFTTTSTSISRKIVCDAWNAAFECASAMTFSPIERTATGGWMRCISFNFHLNGVFANIYYAALFLKTCAQVRSTSGRRHSVSVCIWITIWISDGDRTLVSSNFATTGSVSTLSLSQMDTSVFGAPSSTSQSSYTACCGGPSMPVCSVHLGEHGSMDRTWNAFHRNGMDLTNQTDLDLTLQWWHFDVMELSKLSSCNDSKISLNKFQIGKVFRSYFGKRH